MTKNLCVLYVEDEQDIRDVAEFALEDEGFELNSFGSGQEALDNAQSLKPDLLLLDVMLPGMDGPTTLSKLRTIPGYENIPTIFMTAKVQPQEVIELKALGALDVIAKPFDPITLADDIHAILDNACDQ